MNSPSPTHSPAPDRSSIGAGILIAIGLSAALVVIDHEMMKSVMTGEISFIRQVGWMLTLLVVTCFATASALGKYQRMRTRRSFIITMIVLWVLIVLSAAAWLWMMIGAGMPSG